MTDPTPTSSDPSTAPALVVGDDDRSPQNAAAASADGDAPAVVAVVVVTAARDELETTLASIAAQDYVNLSVLVVDAADEDPIADRVAEVLPAAYIHRMTGSPGFSAAANQAMTLISGAAFLLFCHDDVALDARCVSTLVEEVYRSNAGIVSPKVVQWNDRRRLQQIGRTSDRFGVQVDLVEPDEFDQEQYDSVRDVFVAPAGVQLVRADLFEALGGFDPVIQSLGEDLDLCWRAHIAGARVLAVPAARARHLDQHEELGSAAECRQLRSRHRLRTLLVCSSRSSLIKFLPLAIILLMIEAAYCLVSGRRKQAGAALRALSWNATRLDEVGERRQQVAEIRKVSDREVHALQVGGSARVSEFFNRQFGERQDRFTNMVGSVRDSISNQDSTVERDGLVLGSILILVVTFGSRNLLDRGLVPIGQIPLIPSAGSLLSEWWGGWRGAGLGGPGNAPTAFVVLGLLKALFFWSPGLLDWMLLFGPIVIGSVGMWRLVQPFDSLRASALATAAYVLNPLLSLSMSTGRWDALVLFAVAPSLLGSVLRLQGVAPFGVRGGALGPGVLERDLPVRVLRFGLLVAAVATFVPAVIPIAVLIAAVALVGSVLVARPQGSLRLGLGALAAIVVPTVLHIPFSVDVLSRFSWEWLVGSPSPNDSFDSLADLVRFAPDGNPSRLGFGLAAAALVGLLIGRGRRFDVAVIGWTTALGCWLVLWADRRDLLPVEVPASEVLLVPAAAGLALSVGLAARAIEVDLRSHRFGWRHVSVLTGAFGLASFCLIGLSLTAGGRWNLPDNQYGAFTGQLASRTQGQVRVLWLAHPAVANLDTTTSPGGTYFAVTDGAQPSALNRWIPGQYGAMGELGERLDLAARGETVRLGRLLGLYGIDYLVVLEQLAPAPYEGTSFHPDPEPARGVVIALESQLDLERLTGLPNLVVYRNDASAGPVVDLEGLASTSNLIEEQLRTGVEDGIRVDLRRTNAGQWSGVGIESSSLWIAEDGAGWGSDDGAVTVARTEAGMMLVESTSGEALGSVELRFVESGYRHIALALQALLVMGSFVVAQARRESS